MTSYHEYNKYDKGRKLIEKLLEGKNIALITDAGTPGISDPGEELVVCAMKTGIRVTSVPRSGCMYYCAYYVGLPRPEDLRLRLFCPLKKRRGKDSHGTGRERPGRSSFTEAPHRLVRTLKLLEERLGAERNVAVCRELTKKHRDSIQRYALRCGSLTMRVRSPEGNAYWLLTEKARKEIERERTEEMGADEHRGSCGILYFPGR